jgi:trehalose synthase-fused probable maltokinase
MSENSQFKGAWALAFGQKEFIAQLQQAILPAYLPTCRWYAGKAKKLENIEIVNHIPMPTDTTVSFLCVLKVHYLDHAAEHYFLPLLFVGNNNTGDNELHPKGIISILYFENQRGLLVDATFNEAFQQTFYSHLVTDGNIYHNGSSVQFQKGSGLAGEDIKASLASRVLLVEQSNSAIIYGEKYFLKIYRKLYSETNPELDMVTFLTEHSQFPYIAAFAGSAALLEKTQPAVTLAVMQHMVDNRSDAWTMVGQQLDSFVTGFMGQSFTIDEALFDKVELLAARTAEMHLALYSPGSAEAFAPKNFDEQYRQFLGNRIKKLLESRYIMVLDSYTAMDAESQKLAWDFMEAKELIDEFLEEILKKDLQSLRTRIHGDYHLGQILATENDFIIIDFEGEPESSINERKIKHSPLKDVAGMIRSFHYAISSKFQSEAPASAEHNIRKAKAADRWYGLIQRIFLEKYIQTFGHPHPLFKNNNEINFLLLVYLLEKAVYELGYEVNYRPSWVKIPLKGIVEVIREIEKLKM